MLPQKTMIARLRQICAQDERLQAAMLYGSFTRQDADQYSDIDCLLYFSDGTAAPIDQQAWVGQIAPVELYYHNEFGVGVAIFTNLVRGEFHFDRASDMEKIEFWRGTTWFPSLDATILLDRTGELAERLRPLVGPPPSHDGPQDAQFVTSSFFNWFLFGSNVLARGEQARALEILNIIHTCLLRMARLAEGQAYHWITPTKALESEISPGAHRRYQACTCRLEEKALREAYRAAWEWGRELIGLLAQRYSLTVPTELINKLHGYLSDKINRI